RRHAPARRCAVDRAKRLLGTCTSRTVNYCLRITILTTHQQTPASPAAPAVPVTAPCGERQQAARDRECCCRPACVRARRHALCPPLRARRCVHGSRYSASTSSAVPQPGPDTFGRCRERLRGNAAALSCSHVLA